MPKERFYHPTVVEGCEQAALDSGRAFEVAWGRVSYQDAPSVAIAGIPMDESAVTRLISTLKRARRQAWPHRAPCINGSVCAGPHCPPKDRPLTPVINIYSPTTLTPAEAAAKVVADMKRDRSTRHPRAY